MSLKIKKYSRNGVEQTEITDGETLDQTVVIDNEGYSYNVGLNATLNLPDDRGISAVSSAKAGSNIVADTIPFGDSRS